MGRLISVRAGRGRVDMSRSLADGAGRSDVTTWTLTVGGAFVYGTTEPDASNTGVRPGTVLTLHPGDYVTSGNGEVIEALEITGYIRVLHANVTIRDCLVRGRDTGNGYVVGGLTLPATPAGTPPGDGAYARVWPGWYGLIDATNAAAIGTLIEFCTLLPDYPAWWNYGVGLHHSTIQRCNLSSFSDGVESYGNNVIRGNYLHDPIFYDLDYNQRGSSPAWWSHNDGVMITGGGNGNDVVFGNSINMHMTGARVGTLDTSGYADRQWGGCITAAATNGPINNIAVTWNWLRGGAAGFQCNGTNTAQGWTGASNDIGEVSGNRLSHDQHDYDTSPSISSTYQLRWAVGVTVQNYTGTNTWMNDPSVVSWDPSKVGQPLTVGFTGGIRIP